MGIDRVLVGTELAKQLVHRGYTVRRHRLWVDQLLSGGSICAQLPGGIGSHRERRSTRRQRLHFPGPQALDRPDELHRRDRPRAVSVERADDLVGGHLAVAVEIEVRPEVWHLLSEVGQVDR